MPVARETGDWAAALALVALGQGITISTSLAVEPCEDARVVARRLPDAFPARPYGVALRRGRTPGLAARRFIEALRSVAEAFEATWAQRG